MKRARKSLCKNDFSHTSPFHNPFISLFFSLFFYLSFLFILFFVFLFFIFLVEEAIGGLICLTNTRSLQPFYLSLLSPIFNHFFSILCVFTSIFLGYKGGGDLSLLDLSLDPHPRKSFQQPFYLSTLSSFILLFILSFCVSLLLIFFWGLGFGEVRRPLQLSPTPPPPSYFLFSSYFQSSIFLFIFVVCFSF